MNRGTKKYIDTQLRLSVASVASVPSVAEIAKMTLRKVFPALGIRTDIPYVVIHGFGTLLGLNISAYKLTIWCEDANGDQIAGVRINKTTIDTASITFSDTTLGAFTGEFLIEVTPYTQI